MAQELLDIQVDTTALRSFATTVQSQHDGSFSDELARSLPLLDLGAGAVGRDARFTEAADVDRVGDQTTSSVRDFAQGLAQHVATLTADVRNAADHYRAVDQAAADADMAVTQTIHGVGQELDSVHDDFVRAIAALSGRSRNS